MIPSFGRKKYQKGINQNTNTIVPNFSLVQDMQKLSVPADAHLQPFIGGFLQKLLNVKMILKKFSVGNQIRCKMELFQHFWEIANQGFPFATNALVPSKLMVMNYHHRSTLL